MIFRLPRESRDHSRIFGCRQHIADFRRETSDAAANTIGFLSQLYAGPLPAGSRLSPRLSLCRSGHNDRLFASNPGEHRAFDPRRIAGHPSEGDSIAEQFFVGLDRAT